MSRETVLVTGAAGGVGSTARTAIATLREQGHHVRAMVYFTMAISPTYLEAAANVAVTAKSLGVKAFVNLSQMTVSEMSETETTESPEQKQEWLADQMLRWSGLPVVYLRPTAFFDGAIPRQSHLPSS
jgi:uncharacterized protein YbjT (DUF2867 family)